MILHTTGNHTKVLRAFDYVEGELLKRPKDEDVADVLGTLEGAFTQRQMQIQHEPYTTMSASYKTGVLCFLLRVSDGVVVVFNRTFEMVYMSCGTAILTESNRWQEIQQLCRAHRQGTMGSPLRIFTG